MDSLKMAFASPLFLAAPDYGKDAEKIVVTTDAGPNGWGAVLSQSQSGVQKPIEFESGFWNPTEKRYNQLKRELLAICRALRKWKFYVHGRNFIVETDCHPLASIIKSTPQDLPNAVLTRWLTWVQLFDFDVSKISGKANPVADALSRRKFEEDYSTDFEEFLDAKDGVVGLFPGKKPLGAVSTKSSLDPVASLAQGQVLLTSSDSGARSDSSSPEASKPESLKTQRSLHVPFKKNRYEGTMQSVGVFLDTQSFPSNFSQHSEEENQEAFRPLYSP